MSLTKDALQHIEESHKTGTEAANGDALIVGSGFQLIDLEQYRNLRRRFRGTFQTQGLAAFTGYLAERANQGTPVFIDRDSMTAKCFLDIGDQDAPGHCAHRATLNLPQTPRVRGFQSGKWQYVRSGRHCRTARGLGAPDGVQEQQRRAPRVPHGAAFLP
ncbi:YfdQ family protein [Halomonas elongata]|uniref:YfdQ family protein n=1 Tax=Halomonas elongata TaxID=2746 RepID=UPI0021F0BF36|nr:YfdQ family protein [Halomonas elongata]